MKFDLEFVKEATGGRVLSQPHKQFADYSVDNRSPRTHGSLFIALKGELHDAHRFIPDAIRAGATGVLCHQWQEDWRGFQDKVSFILVEDTLQALKDLASQWRKQLPAKVIALSGSNGKTTSKDFLAQILSVQGRTWASRGSFNNHWGVPFTLLDCPMEAQFCVLEMGMNHSGELTELATIAQPEIVGLTNVGRAHIGNFADGIQGVARAKEELFAAAPSAAMFIFNLDNPWVAGMRPRYGNHRQLSFSLRDSKADIFLQCVQQTAQGYLINGHLCGVAGQAEVHFWGEQNIENLALASGLALAAGMEPENVWAQLPSCHTGWGRNQWVKSQSGARILFDAYNANPESFHQLIENLRGTWQASLKYHAVFSEMRELGGGAESEHEKLGERAAGLPWASCLFIGPSGAAFLRGWKLGKSKIDPVILNTYEESLALDLASMLDPKSQIIVKGSRGGALERIVERMQPIDFTAKK